MQTEKLYYADGRLFAFTAQVLSCRQEKEGCWVVLDRTAFYPEGGGQPADRGTLEGLPVLDVQERDGEVRHRLASPLAAGSTVTGRVDELWRQLMTQQHTGEHMLSGLAYRHFGCNNVGFHIGQESVRVDFDRPLDSGQLQFLEEEVNRAIWADLPVRGYYPDAAELAGLDYRSKKELEGPVRILTIPGCDCCACCGLHAARTGEVGLVKIISAQNYKGGVRLELLCGRWALEDYAKKHSLLTGIAQRFSVKPYEAACAVEKLEEELAAVKLRADGNFQRYLALAAAALPDTGRAQAFFEEGLSPDDLRRCALAFSARTSGPVAVFSPAGEGFQYALCQRDADVRPFGKGMNEALRGRGGGRPELVQGRTSASRQEIEAYFSL